MKLFQYLARVIATYLGK